MHRLLSAPRVTAFILLLLSFYTSNLFAQAPVIKYTTPHVYKLNNSIPLLTPTNSGGAVPPNIYGQVSTLSGKGPSPGGSANGPVADATFSQPRDAAMDAQGNIYVLDDNNTVRKITPTGFVQPFAGSGAIGFANGTGAATSFSNPTSLAVGNDGNIYICDNNNNAIRKITPAGFVSTVAGNGTIGFSNGLGAAATFHSPCGIALDANNNIYVADQFNNAIRKITPAGVVSTLAGDGNYGSSNGTGSQARFSQPNDVAVDAAGNVYVCDGGNHRIQKITPAGVVTTFAGRGTPGFVNGPATTAAFNFPTGVVVDAAGNLYVSDAVYNQSIRKITPDGVVSTLAGSGNIGYVNGVGTSASFSYPYGIGLGTDANLYIADNQNQAFRKIAITGYTIDKPLPAGLVFDAKTGGISGTPTVLSPLVIYTITALNAFGSSSTTLSIEIVEKIALQPSVITFPPAAVIDANNILHPGATSTNNETPITYTSSNPDVAYIGTDGQIHVIASGETIITANQSGNDNYSPAVPTQKTFNIPKQNQEIIFPLFAGKNTCSADFPVGATSATSSIIPLTYSSDDPDVATVSAEGIIHIVGPGTALITVSQAGNSLYNTAVNQLRSLMIAGPVKPKVKITPDVYGSCEGMVLTYTAETIDAGIHPTYQWKLNGQNSGGNSDTYTSTSMRTGDVLTCIVINNDGCEPVASDVSNQAFTESHPYTTLALIISSSATGTVTFGTPITFKAVPNTSNIIEAIYQWYINGQPVGTNNAKFTSNTLLDGDLVTCAITAGGECILNPSVASNAIIVSISIPEKITIPNAFTPNGDGHNDTWYISGLISYTNCAVNIYNRYGAMVYNSVGYQHPWDGSSNGKQVPPGVYYYVIDPKSGQQKLSGQVTVLR